VFLIVIADLLLNLFGICKNRLYFLTLYERNRMKKNPGGLIRYASNPILTKESFPGPIRGVFNSGAIKFGKEYILLCRVEDTSLHGHLWIARSKDGYNFVPDPAPIRLPEDSEYQDGIAGCYFDARITCLDGTYYIVHAAADVKFHPQLAMLRTNNFIDFEFVSFPGSFNTRNGVLFPERLNGDYVLMERSAYDDTGDIWLSYSKDLVHWGRPKVMYARDNEYWHYRKVGGGAVPIKTDKGWLTIFHGVHTACVSHLIYHLGVMLLDLEDPTKVISHCPFPILSPIENYELNGSTPSVVFTCGAVVEDDRTVKIYYGGADTVMCVADTTVDSLLQACMMSRDGWIEQL
jgi:predicted GH43/DUF377 family glycosyl hydrolase